ncbi:hypothetical protein [Methylobacterium sp. WL19]|uniref:hypothetical protein n=1 Tax=Methylobacterium sp. WL19 TaxID=2603896 RepID=UPI0011C8D9BD|nr:hypothetical protein [Methylobacterium sp. WL19]TXN21842.1 hypothetical protein FV220_22610 [Methylobacterium sp. WL19]
MTAQKPTPEEALANFEDAMLENLLATSDEDLRAEVIDEGGSPDAVVATMRARLAAAAEECTRMRLGEAKAGLEAFRAGGETKVVPFDVTRQRERLAAMRRGDPAASGMMMAARKGQGLSEGDEEGLLQDLADLDRLDEASDRDERG